MLPKLWQNIWFAERWPVCPWKSLSNDFLVRFCCHFSVYVNLKDTHANKHTEQTFSSINNECWPWTWKVAPNFCNIFRHLKSLNHCKGPFFRIKKKCKHLQDDSQETNLTLRVCWLCLPVWVPGRPRRHQFHCCLTFEIHLPASQDAFVFFFCFSLHVLNKRVQPRASSHTCAQAHTFIQFSASFAKTTAVYHISKTRLAS